MKRQIELDADVNRSGIGKNTISSFVLIMILLSGCGDREHHQRMGDFSSVSEGVLIAVDELRDEFGSDSVPSMDTLLGRFALPSDSTLSDSAALRALISKVYTEWDIAFDRNQRDLFGMLPHTTVMQRKGSCLGVSMLMLMIGEKTGIPLRGVVLPGHFFLRFQNDEMRENIEPNRNGYNHPDSYYRKQYEIEDSSWYTLESLTPQQSLGVFFFNLANFCRQQHRFTLAEKFYRRSVRLLPCYAEAWGNLAILFEQYGKSTSAQEAFKQALACNPKLPNLYYNYATFELQHGRYSNAAELYRKAMLNNKVTPELLQGLAHAYKKMGKADSAEKIMSALTDD